MMKKLNDWFEIDEKEYIWYILQGYEIVGCKYTLSWALDGYLHREDGPAYINADGRQIWYLNGQCHRTDGPASIYENGTQTWILNDQFHRTDGPAIIRADGSREWWLNGKRYSEKRFNENKRNTVD